jgi:hypothetical protein
MFRLTATMNSHFFPPSIFHRLVLLMEAYCVLCEVRAEFLYIVTSFSPRKPGFDPRPVYARFVFAKVALVQRFLREYTSAFPNQYHSTIFIHTLLLLEGQMDEAWEPSKKQFSFGSSIEKYFHFFFPR